MSTELQHPAQFERQRSITTQAACDGQSREDRETPNCTMLDPSQMVSNTGVSEVAATEEQPDGETAKLERVLSERPWSSFGPWEKKLIVSLSSLGAFFSPLTTNIYFPALTQISTDVGVSISQVNLSITTYMIFQGVAPSFIGTFADKAGRRPSYIIGFVIYIASNIGLALNNSYTGLMLLRCIQSCGSSGMATLKTGIIADIVTSAERGSYIGYSSLGTVLGPSIAPIAGGLLAQYLGWHSIFWFLVIFSAVFFIPLIAFFPETCRAVVGDGSIPPASWNKSLLNVYHERKLRKEGKTPPAVSEIDTNHKRRRRYPNPWSTIKLMCEKETALILLFQSIIYAGFYAVNTTITPQFTKIYHLSPSQTGLLFLPQAVGTILAAFTNGHLLDANFRRHAKRLGIPVEKKHQRSLVGFPIERARFEIALPMFVVGAFAGMAYGWLLEAKVHIAGPIVMLLLTGYTCLAGFATFSVLLIDIHRDKPATASSASNLARCLLGAGASAVVNPMIEVMGNGWCFTLIALVWLLFMPILWILMKYGPEWRRARHEKEIEKEKEKALQREEKGVLVQKSSEDGQTECAQ